MSVVFKALSVEKCLPPKGRSSSRFIILCVEAIRLVDRTDKHYIHVGIFGAEGPLLLPIIVISSHQSEGQFLKVSALFSPF